MDGKYRDCYLCTREKEDGGESERLVVVGRIFAQSLYSCYDSSTMRWFSPPMTGGCPTTPVVEEETYPFLQEMTMSRRDVYSLASKLESWKESDEVWGEEFRIRSDRPGSQMFLAKISWVASGKLPPLWSHDFLLYTSLHLWMSEPDWILGITSSVISKASPKSPCDPSEAWQRLLHCLKTRQGADLGLSTDSTSTTQPFIYLQWDAILK